MEKIRVLLVTQRRVTDELVSMLQRVSPRLVIETRTADEKAECSDIWKHVEVLYTDDLLPPDGDAPCLRWIQGHYAGVDRWGQRAMSESVIWTTTNGIHSPQVAELVLTLMLALARKLPLMFKLQEKGEWCNARHEVLMPRELRQATAGIIGYGNIGRQVGYLCRAFGMRVIAADRKEVLEREPAWKLPGLASPADAMPDKLFDPSDITPLLQESDYVVLCVPATPQTIGLINDRALASMKASCVLINVARGGVVDEDALVEALRSHRIGGAALDVFAKEPLPPSSPLWKLPNMIITHHVAGLSPYYLERSMTLFAENLRRYVAGEQLLNVVDRVRGY